MFNLTARASTADGTVPVDGTGDADGAVPAAGKATGGAPPDAAEQASELSRRGSAYAARQDYPRALADLTRASELAPEEPDYRYERGMALWKNQQPKPALADFDAGLALKPDHVPLRLVRAELRIAGHDTPGAIDDLDAADRFASREADARFRMAYAYARVNRLAAAVAQWGISGWQHMARMHVWAKP